MKPSKPRPAVRGTLWAAAAAWYVLCFYLSWQDGDDTYQTSWGLLQSSMEVLQHLGIHPDQKTFHAGLRLFAHFGIFFAAGFLQDAALYSPVKRRIPLSAAISSLIAVVCEAGKVNIPGRHFELHETALNVAGAVSGVLLMEGIRALLEKRRKGKTQG